jgi:two-component system nitrogen regulation sensor histidine kinase NtrY
MPMVSLAQTSQALVPDTLVFSSDEDKQDLLLALSAIARRGEHLGTFINRFAQVSQLPDPVLQRIEINALLTQVLALYQHHKTVQIERENAKQEYWLMADPAQIEQVMVNLLKNGFEAVTDSAEKKIVISLHYSELSQLVIDIADSGQGVEPYVQASIFIPFFTTKKAGSGIGLSLSKQVMVNHGGDLIYVDKSAQQQGLTGACFRLVFC